MIAACDTHSKGMVVAYTSMGVLHSKSDHPAVPYFFSLYQTQTSLTADGYS